MFMTRASGGSGCVQIGIEISNVKAAKRTAICGPENPGARNCDGEMIGEGPGGLEKVGLFGNSMRNLIPFMLGVADCG
jgi:hypothetical protein